MDDYWGKVLSCVRRVFPDASLTRDETVLTIIHHDDRDFHIDIVRKYGHSEGRIPPEVIAREIVFDNCVELMKVIT